MEKKHSSIIDSNDDIRTIVVDSEKVYKVDCIGHFWLSTIKISIRKSRIKTT